MEELRNEKGQTLSEFLADYDENKYRRPSVTVDMAVFTLNEQNQLCVLLIKRRNHPFIGGYALPGGFVEFNEDIAAAAARELEEETGVKGLMLRQYGAFGGVDRDPRTRIITCAYYAVAPKGSLKIAPGDDAADALLFTVNTKLEAYCAMAERYAVELENERGEKLCARAMLRYDELGSYEEMAVPVGKGALGGDHDLVLFGALKALKGLPRERVALLLAKEEPSCFIQALCALDAALYPIPEGN